jgi:hypothetical protein
LTEYRYALPEATGIPMQLMIAVFDFPEKSDGSDGTRSPHSIVDYVRSYRVENPER